MQARLEEMYQAGKVGPECLVMAYAVGGHFDKAVRVALKADLVELS